MMPLFALASLSGVSEIPTSFDALKNLTSENSVIIAQDEVIRKEKAALIDNYFALYNAPLEGHGMKFIVEAEKNDIDWRLLPAIAMRESTGGIHACKRVPNSVFGYGSCKISFKSIDDSIEIVARSIGGNNPKTAHHYDDKTTIQILKKYNSYIPNYSKQVVKMMEKIQDDGVEII